MLTQITALFSCPCGGNYGVFPMSGTVAPDGSVVLTGTGFIPASGLSGAFTLRLRMANPIALAGTISTDLIFGGIVRATLTGTILSAARE